MGRKKVVTTPFLERVFVHLGENIRLARLRRRFSAEIVAQRAGVARNTLRAIERGDTSVTMGAYANVLNSLGLEKDLALVARDDELGRKLQDAGLPTKARSPRIKRSVRVVIKKAPAEDEKIGGELKRAGSSIKKRSSNVKHNATSVKKKHE